MDCKPKLRFPEFSGEWKSEEVNELFSHVRNGFVGTATPYYVEKGVPYLQSNNIRRNKIDKRKMVYINSEFHEKNKKSVLKKGDILMVQSGHAGECAVVPEEFNNANCHALVVMTPTKKINSDFGAYYMNSSIGKNRIHKLITGQTINHILASDLKKYKIMLPTSIEQCKIASFLSKVDSKIEKLEKKQELWETYKKGIMQQIFSQKLRFKDENGEDYPDWENRKLNEVSDVRDGTHDSPKYIQNGYPLVTSKNLLNGKIDFENVSCISKQDYDTINKRSKVQIGDILFGMIGTIGNPVIVESEGFAIKNVALIKEMDFLKNSYLIYLLNSAIIDKEFYRLNAGGTQKFIALGLIRDLNIPVPTISEQIKIANFLSAIEKREDKISRVLNLINKFKKGLLQQMFC